MVGQWAPILSPSGSSLPAGIEGHQLAGLITLLALVSSTSHGALSLPQTLQAQLTCPFFEEVFWVPHPDAVIPFPCPLCPLSGSLAKRLCLRFPLTFSFSLNPALSLWLLVFATPPPTCTYQPHPASSAGPPGPGLPPLAAHVGRGVLGTRLCSHGLGHTRLLLLDLSARLRLCDALPLHHPLQSHTVA